MGIQVEHDTTSDTTTSESFWNDVDQTIAELDKMLLGMSEDHLRSLMQADHTTPPKPSIITPKRDDTGVRVSPADTTGDDTSLGEGKVAEVLRKALPAPEEQAKLREPEKVTASGSVKSLIAQIQDAPSTSSLQPTRETSPLGKKLTDRIDIFSQSEQPTGVSVKKPQPVIKRVQSPFLAVVKDADIPVSDSTKSPVSVQLSINTKPQSSQTVTVSSRKDISTNVLDKTGGPTSTGPKSQAQFLQVTRDQNETGQTAGLLLTNPIITPPDDELGPVSSFDADEENEDATNFLVLANPSAAFTAQDDEEEDIVQKQHAKGHGHLSAPCGGLDDLVYSSQLTRSLSPDALYQLNYQQRYSGVQTPTDGSDRSDSVTCSVDTCTFQISYVNIGS